LKDRDRDEGITVHRYAECVDYRQCKTRITTVIPEPVGGELNLAKKKLKK
jgi:hypothetical protein